MKDARVPLERSSGTAPQRDDRLLNGDASGADETSETMSTGRIRAMPPPPKNGTAAEPRVLIEDRAVGVKELAVAGVALEAAQLAVARGEDPERVLRQMLDVGGAVLLH